MNTNGIPDRRALKTADDFLRWLQNRKAGKEQAAEEQAAHAAMVWADDGGQMGESFEEGKSRSGD